jgi:ABC-type amino acid transport substrate-binding protein
MKLLKLAMSNLLFLAHAAALVCLSTGTASATVVWSDDFSATADAKNLNLDLALRQTGSLAPIDYVANTRDVANDYHHQLFAAGTSPGQPLQLAGDAFLPAPPPIFANPTLVSPNRNFIGSVPGGVVGKRIAFDMDVATLIADSTGGSFVQAGITVGAASPLVFNDAPVPHFGVRAIEDSFGGNGPFLQFFDATGLVQNLVRHPAGLGMLSVQLDIDDPADGNPWDGVGSTEIRVSVNGVAVGAPHVIGGGGLTGNYITLSGDRDFNGNDLATHLFDNLTVYALPVPEPTGGLLAAGCGSAAVAVRRRRRRVG